MALSVDFFCHFTINLFRKNKQLVIFFSIKTCPSYWYRYTKVYIGMQKWLQLVFVGLCVYIFYLFTAACNMCNGPSQPNRHIINGFES